VAKPNYRHAKKQKETARKVRQQEKLTRKLARATDPDGAPSTEAPPEAAEKPAP
jgi:hypothetical protein